jgi:hypothetical protein
MTARQRRRNKGRELATLEFAYMMQHYDLNALIQYGTETYIPHLSSRFNSQFPLCRGAVG